MLKSLSITAATLLIGFAGGALFYVLNAPLPWTLGALAAAAILAISGSTWKLSNSMRDGARPVVGVLAGSAFTPEVLSSVSDWWGVIILVAVYSIVLGVIGWIYFRLIHKLDKVTAFFASMPAGLGELTLLGGALGGSMRSLVLIHAVRVVGVVFTIPFILQLWLAHDLSGADTPHVEPVSAEIADWLILIGCGVLGFVVGKLIRFPAGMIIAPMIFSAIVHGMGLTDVAPPYWLVALVQIVIGSIAGARFAGIDLQELRSTALQAILWTLIVLAAAGGAAAVGVALFGIDYPALLLALAPAGMAEMTIVSYALGIETAFVVTCQICRLMLVLTFAPIVFRFFAGPQPTPPGSDVDKPGKP